MAKKIVWAIMILICLIGFIAAAIFVTEFLPIELIGGLIICIIFARILLTIKED